MSRNQTRGTNGTELPAPHLLRLLIIAYAVGPGRGELLKLDWPDVDIRRKESTFRKTKNGETRVVPMTPAVHAAFSELWKDHRLDTSRVFLYKGKPGRILRRPL